MRLQDVMTRDAQCIPPTATLREAATTMKQLDVGALPICDNDRLAGMVTDRDIVLRGVADGKDLDTLTVADVMTPGVVWCRENADVSEAATLMQERQVRRLVVLDKDKRLVGIVSLGDLAVRARNDQLSGHTLEEVSQPAQLARA